MHFFWDAVRAALNPPRFAASSPDAVFGVAAGAWDWAGADSFCVKNPHTISFSDHRSTLFLTHRAPWTDSAGASHRVTEYNIQYHDASSIRGAIVGETRHTDAGVPVVWELMLKSPSSYAWHRTDWLAGMTTQQVNRCPTGTDTLLTTP